MKKSFIGILLAIALVMLVSCGGEDKEAGQEKDTLILGCDDSFPPMGFTDVKGNIVGFDIDLAKAVAKQLDMEIKIKPINWKTKEMELMNKNIDVIWNGYSITAARNEQVEFTKPYLNNEQVLVVKKGSKIKSLEDLDGKVVGCQSESAAETAIKANKTLNSSIRELRTYETYQEALIDLKSSDRIEAVAVDKILINYMITQDKDQYKILDGTLSTEYYGIGCRKDDVELRTAIDKALDQLQEDGTIDKISEKWFGKNIVIRDVEKLTQEELTEAENTK